jgi:glutamate dehydrogenase/leucine dehydrogenase
MIPVTSFANKRVALFGLGGSGLASALALKAGGADVIAFDDSAESLEKARAAGLERQRARKPRAAEPEQRDFLAGEAADRDHRSRPLAVPGRAEGANPESRNACLASIWIPGSPLRGAPE